MKTLRWSIASAMGVLVAVAGAACAHEPGATTATPSAPPTAASPAATAPGTTPPSPAAPQSQPPPVDKGVTVTMSASRYAVGDTLKLTVRNGRSAPVYTEDFQTQCTVVTLQKSAGGSWTDITGCSMGRPTRTVKVEPGAAKQILIDPHAFHLAEGSGGLGFGAGTYRIKFGYRLGAEPMGAQPLTAYSADFAVR
jgi:hypothetical protein